MTSTDIIVLVSEQLALNRYGNGWVVFDETKTYSEILKKLGGKFNSHLKGGLSGWIFSNYSARQLFQTFQPGKELPPSLKLQLPEQLDFNDRVVNIELNQHIMLTSYNDYLLVHGYTYPYRRILKDLGGKFQAIRVPDPSIKNCCWFFPMSDSKKLSQMIQDRLATMSTTTTPETISSSTISHLDVQTDNSFDKRLSIVRSIKNLVSVIDQEKDLMTVLELVENISQSYSKQALHLMMNIDASKPDSPLFETRQKLMESYRHHFDSSWKATEKAAVVKFLLTIC